MKVHVNAAYVNAIQEPVFDLDELREACRMVLHRVALIESSSRYGDPIRSISLTHRPGVASPITDGNQSQFDRDGGKVYAETSFTMFNSDFRDTYFWTIYRSVPFRVGRMRLIVLPSATIYRMHRDATMRAHLAIFTNTDARLIWRDGSSFHVPPDGRVYVADTRTEHTGYNAGDADRIHLVMSMADTEAATVREDGTRGTV